MLLIILEAAGFGGDAIDNNEAARDFGQACFHGQAAAASHAAHFTLHLCVGRAVQPHPWPASCMHALQCQSQNPLNNEEYWGVDYARDENKNRMAMAASMNLTWFGAMLAVDDFQQGSERGKLKGVCVCLLVSWKGKFYIMGESTIYFLCNCPSC